MKSHSRLDKYLDVVEQALQQTITPEEFWPLKPAQITAYFEDSLTVEIFKKTKILREKSVGLNEVATLFNTPLILKNFMLNFASTGLKTANNVGCFKTSFKEREDFFNYLFDVLGHMLKNDIFDSDGKQIILDEKELGKVPWNNSESLNGAARKTASKFKISLFGLVWSLFFDTFYYAGFNIHGPYLKAGKTLIINDYFDLKPLEIWGSVSSIPFERARIYNVYENVEWSMNFFGRENPLVQANQPSSILIEIDGQIVEDYPTIESLANQLFEVIQKQTKFVNELTPLERVKKGADIAYFGLRRIFRYFNEDSRPPKEIDEIIDRFGEEFIEKFSNVSAQQKSPAEIRRMFDPRNNEI